MRMSSDKSGARTRVMIFAVSLGLVIAAAAAQSIDETETRREIAAANMQDAVVIDCQLPGKLRKLGGTRTYLTPGRLIRTAAIACRSRGGEYTLGDLASGTLSLQRWMIPAEKGDAEAQYYVARIHANGMDNVPVDYEEAAFWYDKSSTQGNSEALQELGYLYEQGLGVEKDLLKALNMQREASGLGEDLDYSYKIAEAEKLAADLTDRLTVANEALRDSQVRAQQTEDSLARAWAEIRRHELQTTALVAELRAARQNTGDPNSPKVRELEEHLENAMAKLKASQASVIALEMERDTANAKLDLQILAGQATQLELREILARTETAEKKTESLATQLAESQQRLIRSDQELYELQVAYRGQSEQLTAETARLLEARARSDSDAAAYIAAQEAEVASKSARVASLESELQALHDQLGKAKDDSAEAALRSELEILQSRFDREFTDLQSDRQQLQANHTKNEQQLNALYAEAKQKLAAMADELRSRKRRIDNLSGESEGLRARVNTLESDRIELGRNSNQESTRLKAELMESRQEAVMLTNVLAELRADRSRLEGQLVRNRVELRDRLSAGKAESGEKIELLNAQIEANKSTINAQNLRIASLEKQARNLDGVVADLKDELGEPPEQVLGIALQNALTVLDLARTPTESKLGRFHALLIANEQYMYLDPLETPIKDTLVIGGLLTSRYGFDVEYLTNATDDQIMRKLHSYSNELTPEDNLLIYYAGRGSTPDGPPDRAYWLGIDADTVVGTGLLLAEHVSEKIKSIDAKRILVVTDSCFSKRRLQKNSLSVGRGLDPERFKLLVKFTSRNVLTSGANLPIFDERGDRTHSLFAKYFLKILRLNENVLSGEMLAFEMTQRMREQLNDPQRSMPTYNALQGAGHKAGDFFFVPAMMPTVVASTSLEDSIS